MQHREAEANGKLTDTEVELVKRYYPEYGQTIDYYRQSDLPTLKKWLANHHQSVRNRELAEKKRRAEDAAREASRKKSEDRLAAWQQEQDEEFARPITEAEHRTFSQIVERVEKEQFRVLALGLIRDDHDNLRAVPKRPLAEVRSLYRSAGYWIERYERILRELTRVKTLDDLRAFTGIGPVKHRQLKWRVERRLENRREAEDDENRSRFGTGIIDVCNFAWGDKEPGS